MEKHPETDVGVVSLGYLSFPDSRDFLTSSASLSPFPSRIVLLWSGGALEAVA